MYYNINKLVKKAETKTIWESVWIGIKIAVMLIPTFWAFGHFVLGR